MTLEYTKNICHSKIKIHQSKKYMSKSELTTAVESEPKVSFS